VDSRYKGAIDARAFIGNDPPMGNIGLRFPVERIERYAEQVSDRVTDRQAFALDNICFIMREADRLNYAARQTCLAIDHAKLDITRGEANTRLQVPGLISLLQATRARAKADHRVPGAPTVRARRLTRSRAAGDSAGAVSLLASQWWRETMTDQWPA